jgi:hypothetical protein
MIKNNRSFEGVVAYAKLGETLKEQHRRFTTELLAGSMQDTLWKPDGSQASSVIIRKEIWIKIGGKGDGPGDGTRYPVFYVHNFLDSATATPSAICQTYRKRPLRTLRGAMRGPRSTSPPPSPAVNGSRLIK